MNRRDFLQSTAALVSGPKTGPHLEAIAAEELPMKAAVPPGATGPIVEIRTYLPEGTPDRAALHAARMDFCFLDPQTLLVNFQSLDQRIDAWSEFAATQTVPAQVGSVSIFRLIGW